MSSALFCGSKHAALYSKFRPSPPQELISSIINYLRDKINVNSTWKHAVDIGCGSGQSTIVLAPYFEKVTGCDISESQIGCARKERSKPNIEYKVSDCEKLPFPDSTVQLVTSSQAVHWFDTSKLFAEVKRILVPNGVIAVYGYWLPFPKTQNEVKDKKITDFIENELHEKQLGKYWDKERYIVQNHYRDIILPFKDVEKLNLVKKSESTVANYIGYLSSWSAYQKLYEQDKEKAETLLKDVEKKLLEIIGGNHSSEETILLHTDYFLLMGRS